MTKDELIDALIEWEPPAVTSQEQAITVLVDKLRELGVLHLLPESGAV